MNKTADADEGFTFADLRQENNDSEWWSKKNCFLYK